MLVRREVFDRIGAFDTAYELGETIDWVARASAAGVVMQSVDQVVLRRRIHLSNTGARPRNQRTDYLRLLRASLDRQRRTASSRPLE
jgi:GT2 family glycosyltransferase